MKKITYLKVEMDPFETDETLAEKLPEIDGVEFFQYFPEDRGVDIEREKEWLTEVGLTEAFNTQEYSEALGTTNHTPADIKGIIQKYLDKILTTDKLLIIDRFIFPSNPDPNYTNFIFDILEKYLPTLSEITFIASPRHDETTKNNITALLTGKNAAIQVNVETSDDFHDRFWISDHNSKGLFLGTSLNGYGRKYALVDYINTSDVRLIITELKGLGLI